MWVGPDQRKKWASGYILGKIWIIFWMQRKFEFLKDHIFNDFGFLIKITPKVYNGSLLIFLWAGPGQRKWIIFWIQKKNPEFFGNTRW